MRARCGMLRSYAHRYIGVVAHSYIGVVRIGTKLAPPPLFGQRSKAAPGRGLDKEEYDGHRVGAAGAAVPRGRAATSPAAGGWRAAPGPGSARAHRASRPAHSWGVGTADRAERAPADGTGPARGAARRRDTAGR